MATKYPSQGIVPTCDDHEGEELDTYCRSCEKQTCETCVKTTHKEHDWTIKTKIIKERRNKRQDIIDDISENILPAMKDTSKQMQKNVSRVRGVQRRLIDHINTFSDSLVASLEADRKGTKDWTKEIEILTRIRDFFQEKVLDGKLNQEIKQVNRNIKYYGCIPSSPVYGVFISQLIRYARAYAYGWPSYS